MKMQVKDIKIRTLISGDKEGEVILRTLYYQDVKKLGELLDEIEIEVDFSKVKD